MSNQNPNIRLAWNSLVLMGKANKMLGNAMGQNDFTERDARVYRIATLLSFELCNESFSYCMKRMAKQLSIGEVRHVFDMAVIAMAEMSDNFSHRVMKRLEDIDNEADRYKFKAKVIKETVDFLQKISDLIETNVTYTVGEKQFVIYQNQDFQEKTKRILIELDKCWDVLTAGFTKTGVLKLLDDLRRDIKRLMSRPVNLKVENSGLQDITPDDKKTPRRLPGEK